MLKLKLKQWMANNNPELLRDQPNEKAAAAVIAAVKREDPPSPKSTTPPLRESPVGNAASKPSFKDEKPAPCLSSAGALPSSTGGDHGRGPQNLGNSNASPSKAVDAPEKPSTSSSQSAKKAYPSIKHKILGQMGASPITAAARAASETPSDDSTKTNRSSSSLAPADNKAKASSTMTSPNRKPRPTTTAGRAALAAANKAAAAAAASPAKAAAKQLPDRKPLSSAPLSSAGTSSTNLVADYAGAKRKREESSATAGAAGSSKPRPSPAATKPSTSSKTPPAARQPPSSAAKPPAVPAAPKDGVDEPEGMEADDLLAWRLHQELNCAPARTSRRARRSCGQGEPEVDPVHGQDPGLLPSC